MDDNLVRVRASIRPRPNTPVQLESQTYVREVLRGIISFGIGNLILSVVSATWVQYLLFAVPFCAGHIAALRQRRLSNAGFGKAEPTIAICTMRVLSLTFALLSFAYIAFVALNSFFGPDDLLLQSVSSY